MDAVDLSEIVRNYAIVVGGLIGIAVGTWRAWSANRQSKAMLSQADTAHRSHITEVFGNAVALLGDERLEVRLGAIYTLQRIAADFPDFAPTVLALLSAFVRERSQEQQEAGVPPDIQEIATFLRDNVDGRRR